MSDEVPLDVCVSVFKEILLTAKTVAVKIKLFVSHHDFIYGEFLLAILRMGMLIYHQAPARSLSLLMRLMVIPRAKCFEDDVLFEEVYFKEESQLLLFPHKDPLHRYFCAYRDPRLKTITNKSWNEFLKVRELFLSLYAERKSAAAVLFFCLFTPHWLGEPLSGSQATRLCSTITGLSTIRSYANFSRSLKRGSVQARWGARRLELASLVRRRESPGIDDDEQGGSHIWERRRRAMSQRPGPRAVLRGDRTVCVGHLRGGTQRLQERHDRESRALLV